MQRRAMLAGGSVLGALATSTVVAGDRERAMSFERGIPNVEVLSHDGGHFRFYDELVRDRVVLLNFFFTGCSEVCPLVTENLREVQGLLGERMGRDIFMYSITLLPELETPAVLADYAQQWEPRPGWRFLTGRLDDIERLRRAMGFASSDPAYDRIKDNHTGIVRYGNDRIDRWAGTAGLGRPAWIAKAVTAIADVA